MEKCKYIEPITAHIKSIDTAETFRLLRENEDFSSSSVQLLSAKLSVTVSIFSLASQDFLFLMVYNTKVGLEDWFGTLCSHFKLLNFAQQMLAILYCSAFLTLPSVLHPFLVNFTSRTCVRLPRRLMTTPT